MSGSHVAVKTRPSRSSAGESEAAANPGATTGKSGTLSKTAWLPHEELGHSDWLATGRRLGAIGRCSQWWIGDWVRYGAARWGEKYAEAARITGYDPASLRNMAWVASRFDLSLRNDKLTWSHHVLLASLETEEQRRWLQRASDERLSVADLRIELRASQQVSRGTTPRKGGVAPQGDGELQVCPHCGHSLRSP